MTSPPATVERGPWFERLCAEHKLRALPPVKAEDIQPGQFLFSVTGDPRLVTSVRLFKHVIRVIHVSGVDTFERRRIISFIAEREVGS